MEPEGYLPCPPLAPSPSSIHSVRIIPPYFPKIHTIITLPSISRSSEWSLPFRFSDQNFVCISHLSHTYYKPHPSHPP